MRSLFFLVPLVLAACADDASNRGGPQIDSVQPESVIPGALVLIEGENFGPPDRGSVAIGGRPVVVRRWGVGQIQAVVPIDMPGGETYVVVTAIGRPSRPETLNIDSDRGPVVPPRRFPDGDGGVRPPPRDSGPPRPDGQPLDGSTTLLPQFLPDPAAGDGVRVRQTEATPGSLTLTVEGPGGWGAAFHLVYDRNILRFSEMVSPPLDARRYAGEIGTDRVAVGHVFPNNRTTEWAVLRFRVVGRGETRIDFPSRHRTLRESPREDRIVPWTGGTVRVNQVAP